MDIDDDSVSRLDTALNVVKRLLDLSGFDATLNVTEGDERIDVVLGVSAPDDIAILVGAQGQTLAAYQLLANRILQRIDGEGKPVNLDVAGAGEARERRLQRLAERFAGSVAEHGLEARIYGMNPKDRRSMHVALQSMNTIQTFSEDEGIARRLVITRR